jgi:hypothetical protein
MAGIDGDVLCLYYPQQVLPALAAAITYRRRHAIDPGRTLHVLLWSAAAQDGHRANRRTVVETLLAGFPWVRLWTPSPAELNRDLSPRRSVAAKARDLRRRFEGAEIGAIFYPHDLTSDFLPLAMGRAFPGARRVCFGDGLGMVCTRTYFERHMYGAATLRDLLTTPGTAVRHGLARLRRAWARGGDRSTADSYMLILPHDPTGDCLAAADLTIVPYDCARDVLTSLAAAVRGRALAAAPALPGDASTAPLILLGSFAESRMCSERDELALYREVLHAHVPRGGHLLLKPHAAASEGKVARLIASIGSDYNTRVLDRELAEVPIELLGALVEGRLVLSFSYASVALAYFELGEVRHVLTEELIERFFPPFVRAWMLESNRQNLHQQLAARTARQPLASGR